MKSKYNTGKPIDINSLSDEERDAAFHEWAEGSEALERLLRQGYEKGFLSLACCGGDTGKPYIAYDLENDKSRKMAMHIAKELVDSDLDCNVSLYSDFVYTEAEYKEMREHLLKTFPNEFSEDKLSPTRSITRLNVQPKMENIEEVFDAMSKSIREADLDKVQLPKSQEEVPHKEFKRTREEVKNDSNNTQTNENKFIADLESKTYNTEKIAKNDAQLTENPIMKNPGIQDSELSI